MLQVAGSYYTVLSHTVLSHTEHWRLVQKIILHMVQSAMHFKSEHRYHQILSQRDRG